MSHIDIYSAKVNTRRYTVRTHRCPVGLVVRSDVSNIGKDNYCERKTQTLVLVHVNQVWMLLIDANSISLKGITFGLVYLPAIVIVGQWFEKRRALASGIAVCGSGIGAFVFAPLSRFDR